ncbi:tubulin-specific chaperone E [Panulirus ornatus]|uniref:tubulin-specific chaperone E n=1 Tax=Panulirus ornatus TaxID=150431 RepID=UPI003A870E35
MADKPVSIGSRIECERSRGTVKWIGEVPSTQGTWYGVDWDDVTRGRHDGSHKGVKYFETRFPTSGSFVRPTKVNTGMTLEAAVRGRYQDDPTIESQVTEQLQRTIKARFVEVVGMDKVGQKQSRLEELETVVLCGWMVWGTDQSDLAALLPRLQDLDISNSLLSSWDSVAQITCQLPCLRFLNISGNMLILPEHPDELQGSLCHITHLVLNNMEYTWQDILTCCSMFPTLRKLQVAFNKLEVLGPVPPDHFASLEELDIGVNPISSWEEVCHLGSIPRLESLNANNLKLKVISFPSMAATEKTTLFPNLKCLMLANNPLEIWECVGELNRLPVLEDLVITYDVKAFPYFQEFTFARITNLLVLNRTRLTEKERKDCELFYLKSFSSEYYSSGGKEDDCSELTEDFISKHPTYLQLVKVHGTPVDETLYNNQKSQKLKYLKIELKIITPDDDEREPCFKSFLPSTKLAKVKMMIKRHLKINPAAHVKLSYYASRDGEKFEIPMDNDMQEMSYYSIGTGDTLLVRW